jgi:UDP-N-acetylmuramoyl-tripeptide--D-alanyl-D-alanine ligase
MTPDLPPPMMTLHSALAWLSQARLVGDGQVQVRRVHSDTRSIAPGDLFVALRGENFDANTLLLAAQQQGAVAVLCHAQLPEAALPAGLARIEVPDTLIALGELARGWRAQYRIPLIAVTGSNGKTTVTQMLAAILDTFAPQGAALATQGNFNNAIGVPLTLLRMRAQHRIAVVELGMNHPGEIAYLAQMAQPTVALVNNAQREHLEFMHTVEAVAHENGCVISALDAQGVAVFPADDAYTAVWEGLAAPRSVARFHLGAQEGVQGQTQAPSQGLHSNPHANPVSNQDLVCTAAHWLGDAWQVQAQGLGVSLQFQLHIAGRHNVKNALAAAACALAAGVPAAAVVQGLEGFAPVKGRSRAKRLVWQGRNYTVVDDSYNANPDSVRAAIEVLAELPGPRLLVLGDMAEVGAQGPAFHREALAYAHAKGIEHVCATGSLTHSAMDAFPQGQHCADMADLQARVQACLPHVASVLVKGSRSMRMERVVEQLMALQAVQQEVQQEVRKEELQQELQQEEVQQQESQSMQQNTVNNTLENTLQGQATVHKELPHGH